MNNNKYLTVSEFTRIIKNNLENSFPYIYIKGEISNFRPSSTGHWYFSLKDQTSSIKAIIFKNNQDSIINNLKTFNNIKIEDGQEVLVEGRISLYERSGEYSIIINKLIPVGVGELTIKFELLKEKLSKQGLFDPSIKKSLPKFPSHIGIVTSPTGAALQDILNVLKRRFSSLRITVFPASVQGENAKDEIVKSIKFANYHYKKNTAYKVDVLIIARGGGTIEDLWPFNEEVVAYAIHDSKIPVITGIGHEIDFTISDFCADYRAPTPSAAAEIVVKDSEELINSITALKLRIDNHFINYLEKINYRFNQCKINKLINIFNRIYQNNLQDFSFIEDKIHNAFSNNYNNLKQKFKLLIQKINDMSPLNTLARGYSIALDENNNLIKNYKQINIGDKLSLILSKGELLTTVEKINEKSSKFDI